MRNRFLFELVHRVKQSENQQDDQGIKGNLIVEIVNLQAERKCHSEQAPQVIAVQNHDQTAEDGRHHAHGQTFCIMRCLDTADAVGGKSVSQRTAQCQPRIHPEGQQQDHETNHVHHHDAVRIERLGENKVELGDEVIGRTADDQRGGHAAEDAVRPIRQLAVLLLILLRFGHTEQALAHVAL